MNKTNRILGELYYFIGKQQTNFRIFTNYIKSDGSKGFTKWVYYLNATEEELDKATHRTLLKNEIVLDFDPFNNETFEQLKERVNTVCISLKNEGISYNCYSTGSRGFHIHIFSNLLLLLSKEERIEK